LTTAKIPSNEKDGGFNVMSMEEMGLVWPGLLLVFSEEFLRVSMNAFSHF
jgi:hypothetical protein